MCSAPGTVGTSVGTSEYCAVPIGTELTEADAPGWFFSDGAVHGSTVGVEVTEAEAPGSTVVPTFSHRIVHGSTTFRFVPTEADAPGGGCVGGVGGGGAGAALGGGIDCGVPVALFH